MGRSGGDGSRGLVVGGIEEGRHREDLSCGDESSGGNGVDGVIGEVGVISPSERICEAEILGARAEIIKNESVVWRRKRGSGKWWLWCEGLGFWYAEFWSFSGLDGRLTSFAYTDQGK